MHDIRCSIARRRLTTFCFLASIAASAHAQVDGRSGSEVYADPHGIHPAARAPVDVEHVNYAYAQVLNVSPVYQDVRVSQPVEQCDDYERVERVRPQGAGGTVLGALIGGALGNQIGSGSGRRAATVAGAVVGGAIGHEAGTERRVSTETRCHVVEEYTYQPQVVGYDVEYRYRGEVFVSRLDHDPGDRLRIRVAVAPAAGTTNTSAPPLLGSGTAQ